jgi:hypothetical protein
MASEYIIILYTHTPRTAAGNKPPLTHTHTHTHTILYITFQQFIILLLYYLRLFTGVKTVYNRADLIPIYYIICVCKCVRALCPYRKDNIRKTGTLHCVLMRHLAGTIFRSKRSVYRDNVPVYEVWGNFTFMHPFSAAFINHRFIGRFPKIQFSVILLYMTCNISYKYINCPHCVPVCKSQLILNTFYQLLYLCPIIKAHIGIICGNIFCPFFMYTIVLFFAVFFLYI